MPQTDPGHLDTLAFSGLDDAEMRRRALASRDGLDLFKHELSYVRRRRGYENPELPSLIVLPDGPATIESYDGFIDQLANRFNIAVLEIPGFGFSYAFSPAALEFEETCQILATAICDLNLPRLVLFGACAQGLIVARIAEILDDEISGLIIAQTADFEREIEWSGQTIDAEGNLAKPFEGQVSFRLARERATVDWWSALVAGPRLELQTFQNEARAVLNSGCSYALASQMQKWHSTKPLPSFQPSVPAAVIWGSADKSHNCTDKRSVLRYVPDADYIERNDLGHFPDLEDPELIATTAEKLLNRGTLASDENE